MTQPPTPEELPPGLYLSPLDTEQTTTMGSLTVPVEGDVGPLDASKVEQGGSSVPLSSGERVQVVESLSNYLGPVIHRIRGRSADVSVGIEAGMNEQQRQDLIGDYKALHFLAEMLSGRAVFADDDQGRIEKGWTIYWRLDLLVKTCGQFDKSNIRLPEYIRQIPQERFDLIKDWVSSKVGDNGEVHYEGYKAAHLYEFARARQLWVLFSTDPDSFRQRVLEPVAQGQDPDITWLTSMPVTVTKADITPYRGVRLAKARNQPQLI